MAFAVSAEATLCLALFASACGGAATAGEHGAGGTGTPATGGIGGGSIGASGAAGTSGAGAAGSAAAGSAGVGAAGGGGSGGSAPTCDNGILDGDETDVDCGGSVCPPCVTNGDCFTCYQGFCLVAICAGSSYSSYAVCLDNCPVPTCVDAVRNGSETDVDCGGGDCARCPTGARCLVDADCMSGACDNSSCQ